MLGGANLLDQTIDAAVLDADHTKAARLVVTLASGGLIAISLGLATAAFWLAAASAAEIWTALCLRPFRRRPELSRGERINCLAAMIVLTTVWSAVAVLYWRDGADHLRLVAFCAVAGQLIHAQCFSYRSKAALIVTIGIPGVVLIYLIAASGGYHGAALFVLTAGALNMIGYIVSSAAINTKQYAALVAARGEALAASHAKSSFLAMMSHELRTPMNGVLGMANALKTTSLDERQASQVDMLIESGDGLMTILNDLLDISKIEARKLDLEETAFDLHELGRQVHALWREMAAKKGLKFNYDVAADAPRWLLGDPTRIRQIIQNLVSNAVKFTAEGEIGLMLRPMPGGAADRQRFEIVISDTGLGLTEAQASRLFQPFMQADASTARRFGGTGLGLAICRQLAQLMGGEISVDSAIGKGSVFRVVLELPAASGAAAAEPDAAQTGLDGVRILVADDNPINLAVARAVLESFGATVETTADGVGALERLRAQAFDLVLMDIHMPRMDGLEALTRIRAGECGAATVPVIALTADIMAEERRRFESLGFDAVQPKPIQIAGLVDAIARVLETRRPRAAGKAAA